MFIIVTIRDVKKKSNKPPFGKLFQYRLLTNNQYNILAFVKRSKAEAIAGCSCLPAKNKFPQGQEL